MAVCCLYSRLTHDCVTLYDSNTIIKLADDTTVVGLLRDSYSACI